MNHPSYFHLLPVRILKSCYTLLKQANPIAVRFLSCIFNGSAAFYKPQFDCYFLPESSIKGENFSIIVLMPH